MKPLTVTTGFLRTSFRASSRAASSGIIGCFCHSRGSGKEEAPTRLSASERLHRPRPCASHTQPPSIWGRTSTSACRSLHPASLSEVSGFDGLDGAVTPTRAVRSKIPRGIRAVRRPGRFSHHAVGSAAFVISFPSSTGPRQLFLQSPSGASYSIPRRGACRRRNRPCVLSRSVLRR